MDNRTSALARFSFARTLGAVVLAAAVVGAIPLAAWAANPTAGGISGGAFTADIYLVIGTTGPDDVLVVFEDVPAGAIFAGNPNATPALEAVPAEDTTILQVYDMTQTPPEPLHELPSGTPAPTTPAEVTTLQGLFDAIPTEETFELIIFDMGPGGDIVDGTALTGDTTIALQILGGDGDDLIGGGESDDILDGGGGNDLIFGFAGADIIFGGAGNDEIFGGDDDDEIDGGPGNDIINGGDGADEINGGGGNDLLRGDRGGDEMNGGGGWDVVDYITDAGPGTVEVDLEANTGTDGWGDSDELADDSFAAIRGKNSSCVLTGDPDRPTTIIGGVGDDIIRGGRQADVLIGGGGSDRMFGNDSDKDNVADTTNASGDAFIGGSGNDEIRGATNRANFISGDGTIDLTTAGTGFPPSDGLEDRPWEWPPIGTEAVTPITFGVAVGLMPPAPPALPDPINGQPPGTVPPGAISIGSDRIWGGSAADTIYGGGGGDQITGAGGADVLFGDYDNDIDNDGVFDLGDQTLVDGGDSIYGGAGSDLIVGGGGGDTLVGGSESPGLPGDVISGNAGSDTIIGDDALLDGDGFATSTPLYQSGSGNDTVDYSAAASGIVLFLGPANGPDPGQAIDGDGGFDVIMSVENVIGTRFEDDITGNDDDYPTVRIGNLSVIDVNGNPVFDFFSDFPQLPADAIPGADNILIGALGDDLIHGGLGVDAIIGDSAAAGALGGDDDLWGDLFDNAQGGNDFISGNSGNDRIRGQGGDDVIYGGTGADELHGDAGTDTLNYAEFGATINPQQPIRVNLSNVAQFGVAGNTALDGGDFPNSILPAVDIIGNARENPRDRFEVIQGSVFNSGPMPQVLTPPLSTPNDDILIGHESRPTRIFGLAGNDVLIGGNFDPGVATDLVNGDIDSGNDVLEGGTGDDLIDPGTGNDTVVGGSGGESNGDTVTYARSPKPVEVNIGDGQPQNIGGDTNGHDIDRLVSIENVIGSAFNDTITGDAGPNWIVGGAGDDLLRGGADLDIVVNNSIVVREDVIVGGDGDRDEADYTRGNGAVVSVDLASGIAANDGEGGTDRLFEIEDVLLPNQALLVSAGPDKTIAAGGSAMLESSVTGGTPPYSYQWEPAEGLNDATLAQPTASPTVETTYKLTVTDGANRKAVDFVVVKVAATLVVSAGPNRSMSLGQSVELTGSASGGVTPYTYTWSPPDGLSRIDIPKPTASPNVSTTYTLLVTDALGRSASAQTTVTVTADFSISAGPDVSINPGGTATLTVSIVGGTPPYTILWTPSVGLSADNIANPVAGPATTTSYSVRVTDSTGRQAIDSVVVTVSSSSNNTGGNNNTGNNNNSGNNNGGSTEVPRTSPSGDDDSGTPISLPMCGSGMGSALFLNALALLMLRRRRF